MQIGMEPSPDCGTRGQAQCGGCFVCSMTSVFREVYRVLRDDGTLWLNLGDTFVDGGQGMIPTLVALALRADGWLLRQDIIWYSSNKMPESVTNRCSKSHEHIFLLAKSSDYYFDHVAIQQETAEESRKRRKYGTSSTHKNVDSPVTQGLHTPRDIDPNPLMGNKRDVWVVPTTGYSGAHFACYSPKLIIPCILAGTSEHGCCAECSKPYERVVVKNGVLRYTGGDHNEPGDCGASLRDRSIPSNRNGITGTLDGTQPTRETVGWRKVCGCQTNEVVPCTVLDPFVGSGTTMATALDLGRHGVGIDLSETYLRQNAIPRIEASLGKVSARTTTVMPDAVAAAPVKLRGV